MSGATFVTYALGAAALASTAATIDAGKQAKHQGKLQMEQQQKDLLEADRVNKENIAAQERMNNQNLAQAAGAAAESKALMDKQLKSADESMNRANQKRPNTSRIVDEAAQAGRAGASGTMLTGSQGVDPGSLQLGRSTLLGA
jgi:hypothetical protein